MDNTNDEYRRWPESNDYTIYMYHTLSFGPVDLKVIFVLICEDSKTLPHCEATC